MKKLLLSFIIGLIGSTSFSQDYHQLGMDFNTISEKVISVNDNGDVLMFIKNSGSTVGHVWYWQASTHAWTEINDAYNSQTVNYVDAITDGSSFYISYLDGADDFHVFQIDNGMTGNEISTGLSTDLFQGVTTIFRSDDSGKLYLAGANAGDTDINVMEYNGAQWDTLAMDILAGIGATVAYINDVSGYVNPDDEYLGVSYFDGTNNQIALLQCPVGTQNFQYANGTGQNNQLYSGRIEIAGDGTGFPSVLSHNDNVLDSLHYFEYDGAGFSVNSGIDFGGNNVYNFGISLNQGKKRILVTRDEASGNNKVFEWNGSSFVDMHPSNDALGFELDSYSSFATHPLTGKPYFVIDELTGTVKVFSLNEFPVVQGFTKNDICMNGGSYMDDITFEDVDSDSVWISVTCDNQAIVADNDITVNFNGRTDTTTTYNIYVNWAGQSGTANFTIAFFDGVTSDTIYETITVHPDPVIDYSALLSAPLCNTNGPLDPNNYVTPTGGNWSGSAIVNGQIDPDLAILDPVVFYDYYDPNGCYATEEINISPFLGPTITASTATPASCGNADGGADIIVTGGSSNDYFIQWSSGDTNTISVSGLAAGQYQIDVIDTNGCTNFLSYSVPSGDILVATNPTPPTCTDASNGAIDITVTGAAPFTYYWINGETTEDLSNIPAGIYDVTITDNNGCTASEIINLQALSTPMSTYSWVNSASCGSTDGGVTIDTVYGGAYPLTYLWSNAQTTQDLSNVGVGTYSVTITDANSCTHSESYTVSTFDGPYIYSDSMNNVDCNMSNGAIYTTIMANQNAIVTTVWSNSSTTEDITGLNVGTYTLVVTDAAGCEAQHTWQISPIKPQVQPICLVTVDSTTTTNLLVWERVNPTGISHYNIYRETGAVNNYPIVGTVNATDESVWNDVSASPLVTSWRYKMTQVDDCGTESDMSPHHKTMHVTINKGLGTLYNIFWDQYEGISYSTVNLYRYDQANGLVVLATLPSSNTSYTDDPGNDTINLDYFVGFDLVAPCTSSRAQDYNGTRSNRSAGIFNGGSGIDDLSISENGDLNDAIDVYPNPNIGQFTISFGNSVQGIKSIRIVDMRGKSVAYKKTTSAQYEMNLTNLESGIYFVEVINNNKKGVKKIIIH